MLVSVLIGGASAYCVWPMIKFRLSGFSTFTSFKSILLLDEEEVWPSRKKLSGFAESEKKKKLQNACLHGEKYIA